MNLKYLFITTFLSITANAQFWVDPELKQVGYTPTLNVRSIYEKSNKVGDRIKIIVRYNEETNNATLAKLKAQYPDYKVRYSPVRKNKPFQFKLNFGDQRIVQVGVFQPVNPVIQSDNFTLWLNKEEQDQARTLVENHQPTIQVISLSGQVEEYKVEEYKVKTLNCGSIFTLPGMADILIASHNALNDLSKEITQYGLNPKELMTNLLSSCIEIKINTEVNQFKEIFKPEIVTTNIKSSDDFHITKISKGYKSEAKELPFTFAQETYDLERLMERK